MNRSGDLLVGSCQASGLAQAPAPCLSWFPVKSAGPRPGRLTDLRLQGESHTFAQLPGAAPHSRRGVGSAKPSPTELSGELPAAMLAPPASTLAQAHFGFPRDNHPTSEGWRWGSERLPRPPQERNTRMFPGNPLWLPHLPAVSHADSVSFFWCHPTPDQHKKSSLHDSEQWQTPFCLCPSDRWSQGCLEPTPGPSLPADLAISPPWSYFIWRCYEYRPGLGEPPARYYPSWTLDAGQPLAGRSSS